MTIGIIVLIPIKLSCTVESFGGDPGVAAKDILLPESKRGIIIFTNGDNGFDIMKRVETEFFHISMTLESSPQKKSLNIF